MLTSAKLMAFVPTRPGCGPDVLGARDRVRFVDEDGFATTMEASGIRIRLTKIDNHKPVQFTILGWEIPDIEKSVSDLESRGLKSRQFGLPNQNARGIRAAPGGAKVAWFNDPDGNTLSLTQFP